MTRRILGTLALATSLYILLAAIFGVTQVVNGFTTLTAIDQWHPNWPDAATVNAFAHDSYPLAIVAALLLIVAYGCVALGKPVDLRPRTMQTIAPMRAGTLGAAVLRSRFPYQPDADQFRTDLVALLGEAGVSRDIAEEATQTAMSDRRPLGEVRRVAFREAGLTAPTIHVRSSMPRLDDTAQFLRGYGYQAVRLREAWGSDEKQTHELNFSGIIVWHRTDAIEAETSLVELLITAHQAYRASMDDNGEPSRRRAVDESASTLKHVCTKLALRGFVPPELDAEIGRDGTATAEELERWAVAQVVAACSPMARMPLPTVERTLGGGR